MHHVTLNSRNKSAQMSYTNPADQVQAKQVAMKRIMQLFGIGAAGGFGARGLMGLNSMMQSQDLPISPSNNLPHTIALRSSPRHAMVPREDDEPLGIPKYAGLGSAAVKALARSAARVAAKPAVSSGLSSIRDSVSSAAGQVGDFVKDIPNKLAPMLPDSHTRNPLLNEWNMPIGAAALGAGGVGSYKMLDWLLGKERQHAGNTDLNSAEDEYNQALAQQYHAAMMSKNAGDDFGISQLADTYLENPDSVHANVQEKRAAGQSLLDYLFPIIQDGYTKLPGVTYDGYQAFKGGMNTATGAAMLGAGKLTYDWAKGQNKQELLRKALARRQMMRQQLSPPPIVALNEDEQDGA